MMTETTSYVDPTISFPVLYNTQDLMKIMRCGKNQAYKLMSAPAFPSIKFGGKYVVEKKALEGWLKTYQGREFEL